MTVSIRLLQAGYCLQSEHLMLAGGAWRTVQFPALLALLVHPRHGAILYDTGYSQRFFSETRRWPYSLYARLTPVVLRPEELAVAQLRRLGLSAGDVRTVVISHFHADHVGALRDFPRADFRFWADGYAAVRGRQGFGALRAGYLPGLLPSDFDERARPLDAGAARPLPARYAPFQHGIDLFGDESVIAVALPGHAAGQLGLFVNADDGQRYFLVADACWHRRAYQELRFPHPIANLLFSDPAHYRQTVRQLAVFSRQQPDCHIIPSHCTDTRDRYVQGP